jgi:N-acetylmuramoyl-L-alanine amidase
MYRKKIIIASLLLFCFCIVLVAGTAAHAITAKQAYYKAEGCYKHLRGSSVKMRYRENWLRCIEKFQLVYRLDPTGPWASAGLYMSGYLYQQLAKLSGKKTDRHEAIDIYQRIVKRYPHSRYRQKAAVQLQTMSAGKASDAKTLATRYSPGVGKSAEQTYRDAEACYSRLRKNPKKVKYRHNWLQCSEKFQAAYRQDSSGPWAAAALYMTAKLHADLYNYSRRKTDLRTAYDTYRKVVARFPDSRYKVKATLLIDDMPAWVKSATGSADEGIAATDRAGAKRSSAGTTVLPAKKKRGSGGVITVDSLRYWSNPNYTRVVIDASDDTTFKTHLLKKDPARNKPQRLYIDLKHSRLGPNIKTIIPINDDLLIDARAGQYKKDAVRVVMDIKSFKSYKIFSLKDPFRIVIDVWGTGSADKTRTKRPVLRAGKKGKLPTSALAKQLALGVSRIIIDPGHGGRDYGAPGYLKGVHEKNIALQIARRLAKKLRRQLKCEVFLTRNSDRFLTLEERTAIANTKNADLFISIHANSNRDRRAYGIETYFLNLATDDEAIRVAATENATSTKNISDLQTILSDLMQNAKINESSRLAGDVQVSMVSHLRNKRYTRIKDKGVKQAPFYVLLGAQMPAILVETSFISNPRECKRLIDPKYQERLCEAIVQGIQRYIRDTTPTAFIRKSLNNS